MIDGKMTEFVDQLYNGQEIVFLFKGKKYFIQGWWDETGSTATMALEEMSESPFDGYLWQHQADKMGKCAEEFLAAPLWGGKSFYQIESEVTWSDW